MKCLAARLSDGFSGGVNDLIESANRASVVLYTFDVRGVETFNLSALDSVYADRTAQNIGSFESLRKEKFIGSQRSMALLAQGTGGIFSHDNNGLSQAVGNALDDIGNYYLIGYQPQRKDFEKVNGRLQFHKIEVRFSVRDCTYGRAMALSDHRMRVARPSHLRATISFAALSSHRFRHPACPYSSALFIRRHRRTRKRIAAPFGSAP